MNCCWKMRYINTLNPLRMLVTIHSISFNIYRRIFHLPLASVESVTKTLNGSKLPKLNFP